MKNKEWKLQILHENYAQNEGNESFAEWVKLSNESEDLFRWLFGDDDPNNESLSNIDLERKYTKEFTDFLESLE